MRATVTCTCGKVAQTVEATTLADLGQVLTSLLVAVHATSPHEVHGLSFEIDHGNFVIEHELVLQCLRKGCDRDREMRVMVPYVLVGAMTLVFHTAHEGHRLAMSYDGRSWESPAEPR